MDSNSDSMPPIWCMIEGEPYVFSVKLSRNHSVSDLREAIQKKRELGALKDVDPHYLSV